MIYHTEILDIQNIKHRQRACLLLSEGELVAIPTETVYGLAADARQKEAIGKIFQVKNRPSNHPLIVHIDSVDALSCWAREVPKEALLLANKFWPGPLTLVLKKCPSILDEVSKGLDTVALRVPDEPLLREILRSLNTGLVAPSANPHKKLSPTSAIQVYQGLKDKIPMILDGGLCKVGIESTIVDLTQANPVILRKGPITKKQLEQVLQREVLCPQEHNIRSPGNMKEHYQPHTRSRLAFADEIERSVNNTLSEKNIGYVIYSVFEKVFASERVIQLSSNKAKYTSRIYEALYRLDQMGLDEIIIEMPPSDEEWDDVRDRLLKATFSS